MVMHMETIPVLLKIDREHVVHGLQQAREKLDRAEREVVLDFSSVRRIDAGALTLMEELAGLAEEKGIKLALRGINVRVYKVLTLVNLAPRFSFLT